MHNKVKSEQCFAVISAKKVAIFQASLKLVREDEKPQLSNMHNKCLTPHRSNHLWEGGTVNKNGALV